MTERSLRQQRREHRLALGRDQILDAAEQIFARGGFHEASLREIAELAEFSVGAVYGFFPARTTSTGRSSCAGRRSSCPGCRKCFLPNGHPRQQLLDLADWQVEFFRRFPQFSRLVLRAAGSLRRWPSRPKDSQILENFRDVAADAG